MAVSPTPGDRKGARRPTTTSTALTVVKQRPTTTPHLSLRSRISNLESYLCNPKYHEAYLRNFGRHIPMPRATSTNGSSAYKHLPVQATVATTISVLPGQFLFIVPTPEDVYNRPYMVVTATTGSWTYSDGAWFGGISPQGLFGSTPTTGVIDSRALEFKGAHFEVSAAVSYNATAEVTVLDPYTSFWYGKALGYEQIASSSVNDVVSTMRLGDISQRPYYTPSVAAVAPTELKAFGQSFPLVGSSGSSTICFKQVIRPIAQNCFSATTQSVANPMGLGFQLEPDPKTDNNVRYMSRFGQGIYMFTNPSTNTTPISVVLKADYHYRARIDRDSPAVYMMADSKTVQPSPITFEPNIAAAATMVQATAIQSAQHRPPNASAPRALALPPVPTTAASVDPKSTDSANGDLLSKVGKMPLIGSGVERAGRGLQRAWAKGNDASDIVGGLADFALGGADAIGSLLSWL